MKRSGSLSRSTSVAISVTQIASSVARASFFQFKFKLCIDIQLFLDTCRSATLPL